MTRLRNALGALWLATFVSCSAPSAPPAVHPGAARYDVEEKTVAMLQADLAAGRISSEGLVAAYLERIDALDARGPTLRAVLAINPAARDAARALDRERAAGRVRGPLHGIPVLLKDNIESADALPTTAGSLALEHNVTGRDAPIVAQLRAAGAIVLGKANLSEWANIRSSHATSGWSALGGLTRNPYALDRNPCGSSSGSAVAVAANLSALAVGTETDGSITCPSSMTGVVGLKPTLGLVSRTRIIPISAAQDTAGPVARSVADAALLLQALAGPDPEDPATVEARAHVSGYAAALSPQALAGSRLGVLQPFTGYLPQVDLLLSAAVAELKRAGATVEIIERLPEPALPPDLDERELTALLMDFRAELNTYLASTPTAVKTRSLAALIAFNREHAARELPHFGQELFVRAEATADHDRAARALARSQNQAGAARALDALFDAHKLDALIAPTQSPAFTSDLVNGDHVLGGAAQLPAMAGYPHLSVPMGRVAGLPVGLSFIGPAWSEARLLALGHAYEQRSQLRRKPEYPQHAALAER